MVVMTMGSVVVLVKVLIGAAFVSGLIVRIGSGVPQDVLIRGAAWGPVMVIVPAIAMLLLLSTWQIRLPKKN